MTFAEIQKIIRTFIRKNPCPQCKKPLLAKNILVASLLDRHACLFLHCCNCQFDTVADMTIRYERKGVTVSSTVYIPKKEITFDEVLDVKNQLKYFTGDMRNLFNEPRA